MRQIKLTLFFGLLFLSIITRQNSIAQYAILKNVFGSGAVTSSNNNYQIVGTLGQTLIGVNKNSSINEFIGFWYNKNNITVGVEQLHDNTAEGFQLEQNYPNPFRTTTSITYTLPTFSFVSLKLFDVFGREVEPILNEQRDKGTYTIEWLNRDLKSGMYFYQLRAGNTIVTKQLVLLK